MTYNLLKPWESLDQWQKDVLMTKGNICLRSGRQVGKSAVISIAAGEYAINNPNKTVMVIASVERQSQLLFEKILSYIHTKDKNAIKTGKDRPTKSKLKLKNGSKILCLPTGDSGYGIRGFTIDLLIADEAAFINEEVWTAVNPTLAITKGKKWLLSTPHGKDGYYYRCFSDPNFTPFHVSSEECPRKDVDFLNSEKSWMTKAQYAQEYLGLFVDDLRRMYSDDLINECCTGKRPPWIRKGRQFFLGVDVARMGEDLSTFEIVDGTDRNNIVQVESESTRHTLTTETFRKIIRLNEQYNFNKIFIDAYGLGTGCFDMLLEHPATKRKVMAINHDSRPLTNDKKKKTKVQKEDIYNHLLMLMEKKQVQLLDDDEIKLSLRSIQFEYAPKGMIIFGNDAHIADGITRAVWCNKSKRLKPYVLIS